MLVKNAPISLDDMQEEDADLEAASSRADGYQALAQDAVGTIAFVLLQPYL